MNSQLSRIRRSGGYVLVAAMAIMAVMLGTGLAFMRWSTDEATQSHHVYASMQAYYLAQMGVVEKGFQWLRGLQESSLPATGEVILAGRNVSGYGKYEDVRVMPIMRPGEGDFWTQSKWYRISAVGVAEVPFFHDGMDDQKEVKRSAILYVKVRNYADYMYLSNYEMTVFNDRIRFWHGDTLNGRVHSNSQIAIMQDPVFYSLVTQASNDDDFEHGNGYNPVFLGPDPVFHASPVEIPQYADNLRAHASAHLNPGANKQQRMRVTGHNIDVWTWDLGLPFDSTDPGMQHSTINFTNAGYCVFTEAPLELYGTEIAGALTIGSAQTIRLIDDYRMEQSWTTGPPDYRVLPGSPDFLGIVSEGDIKIANTFANGRENSNMLGFGQTNPAFTDIVITAAVVALGESFTFENQNLGDSGYVCSRCNCFPGPAGQHPPACGQGGPDDRGTIYLYGSLTQRRRGYVHRSCCGSTGYLKQYRYDDRFLHQRPPCFFSAVDSTGHAMFDIVQWGQGVETAHAPKVRYN